jgi:hypothetical protein
MAEVADTSRRTMSEWMRGATSPHAMSSLLNLLSALPAQEAAAVLEHWKGSDAHTPEFHQGQDTKPLRPF